MCGICGMVAMSAAGEVDRAALERMNGKLRHRGPDDGGEFVDGVAGLAMRRLSIQDVRGGRQPVFNEDRSVVVVFNGEIYNAPELLEALRARGHRLNSRTDTEVLVHLYEERGAGLVEELRGMFAFALWDVKRRSLLLARDRVGEKPLYYSESGGRLAFASELPSLRECPGVDAGLDEGALGTALAIQYIPGPRTPFRGVSKLPAGHRLELRDGRVTVERYWRLDPDPIVMSYPEAVEQVRERVRDSVRMRLLSDVPLGALLSGGVDSSAVVAMMSGASSGPVKTFSVRFESAGGIDDARLAGVMATRYGCEHHELHIGDDQAVAALPAVLDAVDEPILDPACLPTHLICKLAREHVTVVLTGEGGDEAFAGYDRYRLARWPRVPGKPLRPVADVASGWDLISARAAKGWYAATEAFGPGRHGYSVLTGAPRTVARLTGRAAAGYRAEFEPAYAARTRLDPLNRTLGADIETWLAEDLLQKVDRMSMAVSLEARPPLLDHSLLEFALALPGEYKLRGGRTKAVFKDAVADLLPAPIVGRRKVGFEPPWGAWFNGQLREPLMDALGSRPFTTWKFIDHAEVGRLAERHRRTGRHGLMLYCLFALAEWGRRHGR